MILIPGHSTPDGVVFRAVQVVVRSNAIQVRYQLGLHDNMVQRELQTLSPPGAVIPADAAEAIARYRDAIARLLPQQMRVTIDGIPVAMRLDRADIVRQPHCSLEVVYQIPFIPHNEPVKFILWDDNFQQVPGYHFAAMRARGNTAVLPIGGEQPLARLPSVPEPGEALSVPLEPMRGLAAYVCLAGAEPSAASDALPLPPTDQVADAAKVAVPEARPSDDESAARPTKGSRLTRDASDGGDTYPVPTGGDTSRTDTQEMPLAPDEGWQPFLWSLSWGAAAIFIAVAWWWTARKAGE
jgi:hypothetical protein